MQLRVPFATEERFIYGRDPITVYGRLGNFQDGADFEIGSRVLKMLPITWTSFSICTRDEINSTVLQLPLPLKSMPDYMRDPMTVVSKPLEIFCL